MLLELKQQIQMRLQHLDRDAEIEGWPLRLKDHVASFYRLLEQLAEAQIEAERRFTEKEG